ncbi:hypothetical protein [Kitasatospora sp. P5_F3]
MSELERQPRDLEPLYKRPPRDVQRRVDEAAAAGLVTAAWIQAAAWATQDGMSRANMLSVLAAGYAASDPIEADDYAGMLHDFVVVTRNRIRRLGCAS